MRSCLLVVATVLAGCGEATGPTPTPNPDVEWGEAETAAAYEAMVAAVRHLSVHVGFGNTFDCPGGPGRSGHGEKRVIATAPDGRVWWQACTVGDWYLDGEGRLTVEGDGVEIRITSASGTDTQFHRPSDGLNRHCGWSWDGEGRVVICGVGSSPEG